MNLNSKKFARAFIHKECQLTIIATDKCIAVSELRIMNRVTSGCNMRKQFEILLNGNKYLEVRQRPITPEISTLICMDNFSLAFIIN